MTGNPFDETAEEEDEDRQADIHQDNRQDTLDDAEREEGKHGKEQITESCQEDETKQDPERRMKPVDTRRPVRNAWAE